MLRKLLWVDCTAAAVAGLLVLALSEWLSQLYAVPRGLLLFIGAVNCLYASYSFALAVRKNRPKHLINLLVGANLTWSGVCLGLAVAVSEAATVFGLAQLIGEALFVAGLAALEWTQRDQLLTAG